VFFDMTRTFRIEIEAQQIGARVDGRLGVGGSGDAANLYANHSAYFPWARAPRSSRRTVAGSRESIRQVPIRKASNPAARSLSNSPCRSEERRVGKECRWRVVRGACKVNVIVVV